MSSQYLIPRRRVQAPPYQAADVAQALGRALAVYLFPLLVRLDQQLDKRLVRTFLRSIQAILTFRDRMHGLLLSELGGYLLSAEQARAGTKRISNLLHSPKWSASLLHAFLWQQAQDRLCELEQQGVQPLVVWDESVWEKPESERMEDLCAVRSSKAYRLTRVRKGFYTPRRHPTFVPGLHWLGLLLVGATATSGPPLLAATQWWTTRGPLHTHQRRQEGFLLRQCLQLWGRRVIHICDRNYAGLPWLAALVVFHQRFVVRWPTRQYLRDAQGLLRKPWQIACGKRARSTRLIWDARRHHWRRVGVLFFAVQHPFLPDHQLWLVVSRPGKGHKPWYLLTSEPVLDEEQAWRVVFHYSRRWQLEMSWRFLKSELGIECPRVRQWAVREKLLMMVTLAYGFLLTLLEPELGALRDWLLDKGCHRTGRRAEEAACPLYRLRLALSRLWSTSPPEFERLRQRQMGNGPPEGPAA
jgi:hypothetical protein